MIRLKDKKSRHKQDNKDKETYVTPQEMQKIHLFRYPIANTEKKREKEKSLITKLKQGLRFPQLHQVLFLIVLRDIPLPLKIFKIFKNSTSIKRNNIYGKHLFSLISEDK